MTEQIDVVKNWLQEIKYYKETITRDFLALGKLLIGGRRDNLWKGLTEDGNKFKTFNDFLKSKVLGIGKTQAYKIMNAYEYTQAMKIDDKRAMEIGVEKLSLGSRGKVQSAEQIKEKTVSELKQEANHPISFGVYIDNEKVKVVEQAIDTLMKRDGITSRGEALYLICVDFLSGAGWEHPRKKTSKESMDEIWEHYKEVMGLESNVSYGRFSKDMKVLIDQVKDLDIIKEGIGIICEYHKHKGFDCNLSTVVKVWSEYESNPQKYINGR